MNRHLLNYRYSITISTPKKHKRVMSIMKVLYAEDDIANQVLLSTRFKKHNIECTVVDNGKSAILEFAKCKYDLVILDEYMPEMNGSEVAKVIKDQSPDLPIVAITSDDANNTVHLLRDSGFTDILIKPVSKNSFEKLIYKYQKLI